MIHTLVMNKMPTNPRIFNQIKQVLDDINKQVEKEDTEEEPDADEIIENLTNEGGGIEVVGDKFQPIHDPVKDVQERIQDEYSHTHGLDGSTTKDLKFNNGMIVSIAVATASVADTDKLKDTSKKSTVSVILYFDDKDITVNPESTDDTRVFFDQFPRLVEHNNSLPQWIDSITRMEAEGRHFEWISKDIDGPLFIDGPIIPPEVLIWATYNSYGEKYNTPMVDWPQKIDQILQHYINGIENSLMSDIPVFGVQKSTTATRILDAIEEKSDSITERQIPWPDDGILFNSALDNNSKDETVISYTPWYIENQIHVGRNIGQVTPLKNYSGVNFDIGDYDDYKRAFFFAKPPTQTTVYRIGVPVIMFRQYDSDKLRDIALNEMIKQFREPLPVVIADNKVKIPRSMRDRFRTLINKEAHKGTNEQRNYK